MNLIIPIAKDKPEYNRLLPEPFRLNEEGIMLCIRAIMDINPSKFDNIFFVILKSHDDRFHLEDNFKIQSERLGIKASVIKLNSPTQSQPETVYNAIQSANITGSIFVKDADCGFSCEIIPENSVAVYPLESLSLVDPRNKSYVAVDDMGYITNIIEKKIISHFFNAGGYFIEDVEHFKHHYHKTKSISDKFYFSNIIYSMMLDKEVFRPLFVKDYIDYELSKF